MPGPQAPFSLSPDAQLLDQAPVRLFTGPSQVLEQGPSLAHEQEKPAARVVVLLVDLEVLGDLPDPLAEEGHLDLGRSRVAVLPLVAPDDLRLSGSAEQGSLLLPWFDPGVAL